MRPPVLRTWSSSCWSGRPTGMTSRPPSASCSTSGGGRSGAAAATTIASNGANSGRPSMASSTRGELIPRSRICSYTMARRCSRNSAAACGSSPAGLTGLSGAPLPLVVIVSAQGHASSGGLQVTLPSARGENFFDMRERGVDFVVAVVKVRGEPDARLRAVGHHEVAGQQLAGDRGPAPAIHRNRSGALRGVHGRVHAPTAGERAFDDALALPHGLRADALDADCAYDLEARLAGIKRGDMRRAVQVTEGVFAAVDWTHVKFKRALVREPTGERAL